MPTLRTKHQGGKVVAILCADIHLTLKAPAARAGEPNWLAAMARPIKKMRSLCRRYGVPVLCAGDVFDHWRSPPELINWALDHLPMLYAVPGQHDLPLHRLDDLHKSAFDTLVKAGKIRLVPSTGLRLPGTSVMVYGFPWGTRIIKPETCKDKKCKLRPLQVALIHRHIWIEGHSYLTAHKDLKLNMLAKKLLPYDVAVFGDNHKGFLTASNNTRVLNCGTLMRRRSDEGSYHPHIGLLYDNGLVETVDLDVSRDKLETTADEDPNRTDLKYLDTFLQELGSLEESVADFEGMVRQILQQEDINPTVREVILEALESHEHA